MDEAALPDDAAREILVRVEDAASLFRCATTCKRWRELVADPSFLRRRWPADAPGSSSIFGFFAPQLGARGQVFVPAPQSPLGISRCSLDSFFPEATAGFFDRSEILGARRGLLLVCLDGWISAGPIHIHLAVCNPLHGRCDVLPPLMSNKCTLVLACYAILTGADLPSKGQQSPSPEYSTFFKVLIICANAGPAGDPNCTSSEFDLYMFSSNESRWTAPQGCFSQCDDMEEVGGRHNNAVVYGGTAYWLFRGASDYYILEVSVDTGHVSSSKLSIPIDTFVFAPPWLHIAIGGKISLLDLPQGNQVESWTCRDGDSTAEWLCTRMIELGRLKLKHDHGARVIWMDERSGKLILVDWRTIHIADLGTGATEDITAEFGGLVSMASVPFEVDWAAFFSSRLGGQN